MSLTYTNLSRYSAEMTMVIIQAVIYLGMIAVTRLAKPNMPKLCYRRSDKSISIIQTGLKLVAVWSILASYIMPFFLVPSTLHPLLAWPLYFLGSFALSTIAINSFFLPILPVLAPWLLIFGSLLVMAYPWYSNGVVRALAVFFYAFCSAPIVWVSLTKVMSCLQVSLEREIFFPRLGESSPPSGFNKLYWETSRFSRFLIDGYTGIGWHEAMLTVLERFWSLLNFWWRNNGW